MFNRFNESSVLPSGAILIERSLAKKIVKVAEFKVLLVKCENGLPSSPYKYNVMIGDSIYGVAKVLVEKFGDDLDEISNLKFSEAFARSIEDRYLPVNRAHIDQDRLTKEEMYKLWQHDRKMLGVLLRELKAIKEMAMD